MKVEYFRVPAQSQSIDIIANIIFVSFNNCFKM